MKPLSAKPSVNPGPQDAVVEFDATLRRREKKRGVAAGANSTAAGTASREGRRVASRCSGYALARNRKAAGRAATGAAGSPARKDGRRSGTSASCLVADRFPSASHSQAKSNGNAAATQGARSHQPSRLSEKELEEFLINFVVEQTGYPPEIVELDADLEADLRHR